MWAFCVQVAEFINNLNAVAAVVIGGFVGVGVLSLLAFVVLTAQE